MRYREIVSENGKAGKVKDRVRQSTAGLHTFRDGAKQKDFGSDYAQYRLGMALAKSDGETPLDIDYKSWIGKQKTAHPYTKAEDAMLKQCYPLVGLEYADLNNGDLESQELKSTNKNSPVAKPKPNKYGV
jgi:hypothetical protein